MLRVFKYSCPVRDEVVIEMPKGASILSIQPQYDGVYLWALVDPNAETEGRIFRWHGTGHPIGHLGRHVGTVQLQDGLLVFHLFDLWPDVRA